MKATEEAIRTTFEPLELRPDLSAVLKRADRHQARRRAITFAVSATAMVGVVGAIVIGLLSSPPAEALWDPIPTTPDPSLVATASDLCTAAFPAEVLPLPPLVLIDQRANAARAVFGERGRDASGPMSRFSVCTLLKSEGTWAAPPPGEVPFDAFTVAGVVDDAAVVKVVVDQVDGLRVEAAMAEGFYHFWWISPDDFPGGTMLLLDGAGNAVDSAEIPPRPAP